ncbi:MAG TPA: glycosyltransferase family 4 protein [Polyangiaceae bacterium]
MPCRLLDESERQDGALIASLVLEHRPDVVVIPGWFHPPYVALARNAGLANARFVLTMDTPRRDTWRQRFGRFKVAGLMKRVSRVIVPGERAWQLARMLGAPEAKIRRGLYGVDVEALGPLHARRSAQSGCWPRKFLFIGRYEPVKAIDVLLAAYREYRNVSRPVGVEPWTLTCCGAGPLGAMLKDEPGVNDRGFVQPQDSLDVFETHGAFVLASRFDPWPLVLVEAAASGLPVVHTEACGSAVECVRDFCTGRGVATDDVRALAAALKWCEDHHDELPMMGRRAQHLAAPYSAQAWSRRWSALFTELESA